MIERKATIIEVITAIFTTKITIILVVKRIITLIIATIN